MTTSILTANGQTTVPLKIRKALKIKPKQQLEWSVQNDGSVIVRTQRSALELFGSLKSPKRYRGQAAERAAAAQAVAQHVQSSSK